MKRLLLLSAFTICTLLTSAYGQNLRFFEFGFRNLTDDNVSVIAAASDPAILEAVDEQLALPEGERNKFINGELARGTEHNNPRYSWHFVTNEWELAEMAVEVCDGTPQDVENDPDYWIDHLGYFCPWSSFVREEIFPSNVDEEESDGGIAVRYDAKNEMLTAIRNEDLGSVDLLLVNALGEDVWSGHLPTDADRSMISTSQLAAGPYFLVVSMGKERFVRKFVKY